MLPIKNTLTKADIIIIEHHRQDIIVLSVFCFFKANITVSLISSSSISYSTFKFQKIKQIPYFGIPFSNNTT